MKEKRQKLSSAQNQGFTKWMQPQDLAVIRQIFVEVTNSRALLASEVLSLPSLLITTDSSRKR